MPTLSRKPGNIKRLADSAPPALTRGAARFARLLADARLPAWLNRHGITHWHVGTAEAARFHEAGWIELRHGFGHAAAAIDLSRHPALAAVASDGAHAGSGRTASASADDALRHAVAAALLEPLTERCAELGLGDVRVAAVHRGAPPRDRSPGFAISLRAHDHALECVLPPPDEACLDALEACIGAQRLPLTPALGRLCVPGRLELGFKAMRVKTLRTLRTGDVVLRALDTRLTGSLAAGNPETVIDALWGTPGASGIRVPVRVGTDNTMILTGEPTMTAPETDVQFGHPDDQAALDVSGLSLPIRFEIDTVAMPVSQLTALRPGYVVELAVPLADSRIRMSAHGQTVGFGELVTVGDHLGVRILEMTHGHDPVQ